MKVLFLNYNAFTHAWTKYSGLEFVTDPKKADIIYCSTAALLSKALKVKDKYKKELVCWLWDVPLHQKTWDAKVKMLKGCDLIISASKNTQKELLEKADIKSEQIYFYHELQDLVPYKENSSNYFIQVSRYAETKRFQLSVDAFEGSDLDLACVGFKGLRVYYSKLRQSAGKNVSFAVGMEHKEKIELLKNSIALLSPSIFEGWGLSPMESIACGRPILLSDTPIFREIYGDSALYHKVDDVEDYRGKINLLHQDKILQKKIVTECQKIIEPFSPQGFAERVTSFLVYY